MTAYICSTAQISSQEPLSAKWFTAPRECAERCCFSVDAQYGGFISPMAARRMGKLLKRAAATSLTALREASVEIPDAIIFGTGLGCMENSEKFLSAMKEQGEECLSPTYFINSTHNTIASQIAGLLKCHSYNNTYAHLGVSFESALLDSLMQFEAGRISTALAGGYDELTPGVFDLYEKAGFWHGVGKQGAAAGETAVAMVLSSEKTDSAKCGLEDVALCCGRPLPEVALALEKFLDRNGLHPSDTDLVITGRNGDVRYDESYSALVDSVFGNSKPQACYKHVFGESFTAGAYGVMLGAEVLKHGRLLSPYRFGTAETGTFERILLINSYRSRDWSFILLAK